MSKATSFGYTTSGQARHLRACMVCSIIQLQSKFISDGCPNCEPILNMSGSPDIVLDVTSANFNGTIAVMDPSVSWVAKWQRVDQYVTGMYAVQVIGTLPQQYVQDLQDQGLRYVPRDGPHDEPDREEQ